MPEMKKNFFRGKMNKDADERIVPNGEYRDAMNVQVATSEGSDVGTVQNILGNSLGCNNNLTPANGVTVGSISDEANDSLYWFVGISGINKAKATMNDVLGSIDQIEAMIFDLQAQNDPNAIFSLKDMIMRHTSTLSANFSVTPLGSCVPVFVDTWGFVALIDYTFIGNANFIAPTNLVMSIPSEILEVIQIGWEVTAINDLGQATNTAQITNILPATITPFVMSMDPGFQTIGGSFSPVFLGMGPMFGGPGQPQTFFLDGYIYLNINPSNTINGNLPVGASIQIEDANGVPITQPGTTIVSSTPADVTYQSGLGSQYMRYELSQVLTAAYLNSWVSPVVIPNNQGNYVANFLVDQANSSAGVSFAINAFGLSGSASFILPTASGSVNGDLLIESTYHNEVINWAVGDSILPQPSFPDITGTQTNMFDGSGGCIETITPVLGSTTNPSYIVTIDDCNGTQLFPNPSWGTDGEILTQSSNQGMVVLSEDLPVHLPIGPSGSISFASCWVFVNPNRVLSFNASKKITAINIIDDMLFWTDGHTEPKKINITRSIQGTDISGDKHTRLVNSALGYGLDNGVGLDLPIRKEHITVIKRAPKNPLYLSFDTGRDASKNYSGTVQTGINAGGINMSSIISCDNVSVNNSGDFSSLEPGDNLKIAIETDLSGSDDFSLAWKEKQTVVLEEFIDGVAPNIPISNYTIRAEIMDWSRTSFESILADQSANGAYIGSSAGSQNTVLAGAACVRLKIVSIQGTPQQPLPLDAPLKYAIDLWDKEDMLFELKMPRFSFRYKYEDGEYSSFAPFSEVAFQPGAYDYEPKKGYNLAMENSIKRVHIKNIITDDIPKDVVSIDLLAKEDNNPNTYIVETIKPKDQKAGVEIEGFATGSTNSWYANKITITRESIQGVVEKNQLLRAYDNVPTTAVAQEVTGSRIVYANYTQNLDLTVNGENYKPAFKAIALESFLDASTQILQGSSYEPIKSIKSLREYQLGVVFLDEYGRQSPVLSSNSGAFKTDKIKSLTRNRIATGFKDGTVAPFDAKYFKFYIKETSGEYYNLAMDRWYDAEDGNMWLSFPSTERNKVDGETYLILKKGANEQLISTTEMRYNILSIEPVAPDYIKTKQLGLGSRRHDLTSQTTIGGTTNYHKRVFGVDGVPSRDIPRVSSTSFKMNWKEGAFGNSPVSHLDEIKDAEIYIRFDDGSDYSKRYRISEITANRNDIPDAVTAVGDVQNPTQYSVSLADPFTEDINFIFDNAINPNSVKDGVNVKFWKYKVENSPKFDGRFFVKIHNDGTVQRALTDENVEVELNTVSSRMIYLLDTPEMNEIHRSTSVMDRGPDLLDDTSPNYVAMHNGNMAPWNGGVSTQTLGDGFCETGVGVYASMQARTAYFSKLKRGTTVANGTTYDGFFTNGNQAIDSLGNVNFSTQDTYQNPASTNSPLGLPYAIYGDHPAATATTTSDLNNAGMTYVARSVLETDYENTAVWFIDKSYSRGSFWSTSMEYPGGTDSYRSLTTPFERKVYPIDDDTFINPVLTDLGTGSGGTIPYTVPEKDFYYQVDLAAMSNDWYMYHGVKNYGPTIGRIYFGLGGIESQGGTNNQKNSLHVPNGGSNSGTSFKLADATNALMGSIGGAINVTTTSLIDMHIFSLEKQEGFFHMDSSNSTWTNANYSSEQLFAEKITTSGNKFLWQDDPTETVYSMQGNTQYRQRVAFHGWDSGVVMTSKDNGATEYEQCIPWQAHSLLASPANYYRGYSNQFRPAMTAWDPTVNFGGHISGGLKIGDTSTTHAAVFGIIGENFITVTATNAIEVGMTVIGAGVPDGTLVTGIDAAGVTIILNNLITDDTNVNVEVGYIIIALEDYNSTDDANFDSVHVRVNTTVATCAHHGGPYVLKPGMILTEYNNGSNTPVSNPQGGTNLLIKEINTIVNGGIYSYDIKFSGFTKNFINSVDVPAVFNAGEKLRFRQATMNSASPNTVYNQDESRQNLGVNNGGTGAVGYLLKFVEEREVYEDGGYLPPNPFVWETEPKPKPELDIYYEASGSNAVKLDASNIKSVIPIGSLINHEDSSYSAIVEGNDSEQGNQIVLSESWQTFYDNSGPFDIDTVLKITRPDNTIITVTIELLILQGVIDFKTIQIYTNLYNSKYYLNWHNCYSFGNGVESNRIRDSFNFPFMSNGAFVSTTLEGGYSKEHRKSGLIYSGLYNSKSNFNALNQFIAAEKITKDLNPIYGSIQKLYSRSTADGDLITLCEDRVLKILANKDALFNADGNPQVVATNKVLGQAQPYSGKFGISKDPSSFAAYSYRIYFTDKVRGAVLRLSKDGLTAISDFGMKDWFKDKMKLSLDYIIGSYDDKKGEYNVTFSNNASYSINSTEHNSTLSFKESTKGWVSFKSFIPENGISCANDYYTFDKGKLYLHHNESVNRNTFYSDHTFSELTLLLNDMPSSIKSYTTINYEGTDSKVTANHADDQYYNLLPKPGWYVESIITDKETGSIDEFIEKEGKWFNYIKGTNIISNTQDGLVVVDEVGDSTFDQASFAIQGLGSISSMPINIDVTGCMDPLALNFNPQAIINDNSCIANAPGCMVVGATNFSAAFNVEDGSCFWSGCTDVTAFNYDAVFWAQPIIYSYSNTVTGINIVSTNSWSCIDVQNGCTDFNANNYDATANTDDGSCTYTAFGCTIITVPPADNYNVLANADDGTCTWSGCHEPLDANYTDFGHAATNYVAYAGVQFGLQDDGSCINGGCTNVAAINYLTDGGGLPINPAGEYVYWDDGTCQIAFGCADVLGDNYYIHAVEDGTCLYFGCTDPAAINFNCQSATYPGYIAQPNLWLTNAGSYDCSDDVGDYGVITVNADDGSCQYTGCTDFNACNYGGATIDDGSCNYTTCAGCMDNSAGVINYALQTGTLTPCEVGNTGVVGFCTIPCGDGTSTYDPFFQPQNCCEYEVFGCTDASFCNYDSTANTDDGTCSNASCTGCTDPSFDTYNVLYQYDCNGDPIGTQNANWNGAQVVNGSPCCTNTSIMGCMDPEACNYNPSANRDPFEISGAQNQAPNGDFDWDFTEPSQCVYGFSKRNDDSIIDQVQIGNDATGLDFVFAGNYNMTLQSGEQNVNINTLDFGLRFSPRAGFDALNDGPKKHTPNMAPWVTPPGSVNQDYGQYKKTAVQGGGQTNGFGYESEIHIKLYKKASGGAWVNVHSKTSVNNSLPGFGYNHIWYWNNVNSGNNIPGNSYSFEPFNATNGAQQYKIEIYSVIYKNFDGSGALVQTAMEFGRENWMYVSGSGGFVSVSDSMYGGVANNPQTHKCGISQEFTFNPISCMDQVGASSGCNDPLACNYDPTATCQVTCTYPIALAYIWAPDPNNNSVNSCQIAPCLNPPGTVYSGSDALQDCEDANGGGPPQ